MKLLIMGHADGLGGAQTAFRKLVNFVADQGHTVKVILITDSQNPDPLFDDKAVLGRVHHQTSSILTRGLKICRLLYLSMAARSFSPDIFITIGLSNSANFIGRFLKRSSFKIGQDFIAGRSQQDPLLKASRSVLNGIAVQSPSMLDPFKSPGTLPKGVNWLPCFPEAPFPGIIKSPLSNQPVKMCYFGRLAGNKGLDLLIAAMADEKIPAAITLDIWGTGNEEDKLRALAQKSGLDKRVRFQGKYPGGEKGARLMASYDVLVLCSTASEGLPLILLEAMAYGLPLLVTDVGAIKDCCINNPDVLLVKPGTKQITEGILTYYINNLNNQFNPARQKTYYENHFSFPVMAGRWLECLQNPHAFFYEG